MHAMHTLMGTVLQTDLLTRTDSVSWLVLCSVSEYDARQCPERVFYLVSAVFQPSSFYWLEDGGEEG